jgi:hypothetical protein
VKKLQENWEEALRADQDEIDEVQSPRRTDHVFERHLGALEPNSFVYRTNFISEPHGADWNREYIDDIKRDGLLYVKDFKLLLPQIERDRERGVNVEFCDQVLGRMRLQGAGQISVRRLYVFLQLRDCVRSQYRDTPIAVANKTPGSIVTRMRVMHLPEGKFFPDLYPPDGASAGVHVVPYPEPNGMLPRVDPQHIQIWFGEWIDAPRFDRADLKFDVENSNLERVLFPTAFARER